MHYNFSHPIIGAYQEAGQPISVSELAGLEKECRALDWTPLHIPVNRKEAGRQWYKRYQKSQYRPARGV